MVLIFAFVWHVCKSGRTQRHLIIQIKLFLPSYTHQMLCFKIKIDEQKNFVNCNACLQNTTTSYY